MVSTTTDPARNPVPIPPPSPDPSTTSSGWDWVPTLPGTLTSIARGLADNDSARVRCRTSTSGYRQLAGFAHRPAAWLPAVGLSLAWLAGDVEFLPEGRQCFRQERSELGKSVRPMLVKVTQPCRSQCKILRSKQTATCDMSEHQKPIGNEIDELGIVVRAAVRIVTIPKKGQRFRVDFN